MSDTISVNDGKRSSDSRAAPAEKPDGTERPAKRSKRGRYVAKACAPCQKRKIKCDGEQPCSQCTARKRDCITQQSQDREDASKNGDPDGEEQPDSNDAVQAGLSTTLLQRLSSLESQLSRLLAVREEVSTDGRGMRHISIVSEEDSYSPSSVTLHGTSIPEADGQLFAGEVSINHALERLEQHVPKQPVPAHALTPESSRASLASKRTGNVAAEVEKANKSSLQETLAYHAVVPDREKWRGYLATFVEQVHVLYPFLHPLSIWNIFNQFWDQSDAWSMDNSIPEQTRIKLSLLLFCVAIGRCTGGSRVEDVNGTEVAGWNIYSAAVTLLGDHLDISKFGAKSLEGLQVLVLMVVYLFRLDANQQASRVLAMTISEAHTIGLHREKTLEKIPVFNAEMSRRLWWSIYVLDRRIALETGEPFVIQDYNVDTALPSDLSDEWLSEFEGRPETSSQVAAKMSAEVERHPGTSIPYIVAMIRYSRIVGKAWEIMYGVKSSGPMSSYGLENYIETLLNKLQEDLPKTLLYDPNKGFESQFADRQRWQVQQSLLLHMRFTFIRLLIRKPVTHELQANSYNSEHELENLTVCSSLAANIINIYQQIPGLSMKFTFPFGHYLTSAVMILFGLILKEQDFKRRYDKLVRSAIRDLKVYCRKTWVSGKMIRSVSRLESLTEEVLGSRPQKGASNMRPAGRKAPVPHPESFWNDRSPFGPPDDSRTARGQVPENHEVQKTNWSKLKNLQETTNGRFPTNQRQPERPQDKATATGFSGAPSMQQQISRPETSSSSYFLPDESRSDGADDWANNDSPTQWSVSLSAGLPSWAMTDFEFEQTIHGAGRRPDSTVNSTSGQPQTYFNNNNSNSDIQNNLPPPPLPPTPQQRTRQQQLQQPQSNVYENENGNPHSQQQQQPRQQQQQQQRRNSTNKNASLPPNPNSNPNPAPSAAAPFPSTSINSINNTNGYMFDLLINDQEHTYPFFDNGYLDSLYAMDLPPAPPPRDDASR